MFKLPKRFIVKVTLLVVFLFFITTIYFIVYLNNLQVLPVLDSQVLTGYTLPESNCVSSMRNFQHEIDMLKDQIQELQNSIFNERRKTFFKNAYGEHTPSCIEQFEYEEQLSKSDASHAQSYPTERHVPIYTRFDMWYLFYSRHSSEEKVTDKLSGLQRKHIDGLIDTAVLLLNETKWRRDHFVEGIYHDAETIGTHYELHFMNDKLERKSVTLFRPQAPLISLRQSSLDYEQHLHVVLPLYQRSDSFRQFIKHFENLLVKLKYKLHLTVVYYGEDIKDLMTVFQPYILKHSYRSFHIDHIENSQFSRGNALDIGIRRWKGKGDPLIFLCDVDVIFNEEFINRCKSYTEKHKRVYYPVLFSLYNPEIIQKHIGQRFTSLQDKLKISPDYGFWRDFGYGMACLYRSDYLASGGFDTNLEEWGDEDILLFRKFAQSNLTVIRAPDPGIYHLWHNKTCDASLSDVHYKHCVSSKIRNEGSHEQLGYMALQTELKANN